MWNYTIKDNYLPEETFNKLFDEIKDVKVENEVYRKWLDYDPTPQIAEEVNAFSERRHYGPYKKFIHLSVIPANYVHPEHDEAEFKIMSGIVYLAPKENLGTTLVDYRQEPKEEITLDWKPNRLMTFCGLTDITWHYYSSTDVRYTYNYFLIDPDKIENKEFKKYVVD